MSVGARLPTAKLNSSKEDPVSLGSRIRTLRHAFELSQRQLAQILNVRQATISEWETETTGPTTGNLRRVADLAENDRTVFSWLQNGGTMPTLKRYQPVIRPEPQTSPRAVPEHLVGDINYWLNRQRLSLRLVDEIHTSLMEEGGPGSTALLPAIESTLMALEAAQLSMEGVLYALPSESGADN